MCRVLVLLVVLAVSSPAPSAALVRPWLGGHGTLSRYGMSDVNSDIGNVNAALAGTGLQMDEIHGGLGLGVAFGLELPSRLSIGLGYDRLFASTDVGDASGSLEYGLPANAFRAFLHYSLVDVGASGAYLGGSAGIIAEAGAVTFSVSGAGSAKTHIEGSGPLLEAFVGGDWWAAPRFALSGSGGYRYANIGEIKIAGDTVYLASGEKESVDYSGVFFRAGIKFALTR